MSTVPKNKGKAYTEAEVKKFDDCAAKITSRKELEQEAEKLSKEMDRTLPGVAKQLENRLGKHWNEKF